MPAESDSLDERQASATRNESPEVRLAPHGLRLVAFVVDVSFFALVFGAGLLLSAFTGVPGWPLYAAAGLAFVYYLAATIWLMDGQTAGKAVCGLSVRRIDGTPTSRSLGELAWAFGRHSVGYVIADVLLLGTLSALLTPRRRCVHDYAFGSEVVLVAGGKRAASVGARYREFWRLCMTRYEEAAKQYRWILWPWKWLTRVIVLLAAWLTWIRDAVAAGTSPPVSAAPPAAPVSLKAGAALWAAATLATGAAVAGISTAVPEPDQIKNIDVVTQRQTIGRPETAEIWIMKADGDQLRQITRNSWADLQPDLVGGKIVFTSERDGNQEIYVMSVDGAARARLTEDAAPDWCPDWSPDASRIAFTSNRDGNSEIYVMGADGSTPTRLTHEPAADTCPEWSSDGKSIAFTSNRRGSEQLYVMRADGTGAVQLTHDGGRDPAWSSEMTRIAFTSDRDGNENVYVVGPDGRGETRLTDDPADDKFPLWAPDGSKILFASERGLERGGDELYAMSPDGSDLRKLTSFND